MPQNSVGILILAGLLTCACDDKKEAPKNPTGTITIPGAAAVTPRMKTGTETPFASVHETWTVEAPCACEKLTAKQEIKGFIDRIKDGKSNKLTARAIVQKAVEKITPGSNQEVDDFRKDHPPDNDKSETDFVPDIGSHGSSTYPKNLVVCKKLGDDKSSVELTDEPGLDATAGTAAIDTIKVRLTFRTTILCDGKEIGQFVWHFSYDLPGGKPEVALGELK